MISKRSIFLLAALAAVLLTPQRSTAEIITSPLDLNPGDEYRLVFVTSTTRDATSTNIADYNSFVTSAANSVAELFALGTAWTAIGSTVAVDARDNTGTNPGVSTGVPIYRLDGLRVADDNADLWDGTLLATVSITEVGGSWLSVVWTGTVDDGTGLAPSQELGGLSTISNSGTAQYTDLRWVDDGIAFSINERSFYAMSGTLAVVPEPSTFALVLVAAGGMLAFGWRRRRSC